MIILHFHLQPQYKYELFHIYFTSFHCTGKYELNKLTSLPMCGFIAQLVEHRTGIAEVTGSNPIEALIFFRILLSNCLNWKITCNDHSSISTNLVFNGLTDNSISRPGISLHCARHRRLLSLPNKLKTVGEVEVRASGQTNTQSLTITEENVLPL